MHVPVAPHPPRHWPEKSGWGCQTALCREDRLVSRGVPQSQQSGKIMKLWFSPVSAATTRWTGPAVSVADATHISLTGVVADVEKRPPRLASPNAASDGARRCGDCVEMGPPGLFTAWALTRQIGSRPRRTHACICLSHPPRYHPVGSSLDLGVKVPSRDAPRTALRAIPSSVTCLLFLLCALISL